MSRSGSRRSAWGAAATAFAFALVSLGAACSSSTVVAVSPEGGGTPVTPGVDGSTAADAGADASLDAPASACEGTCKTTSLVVDIGGKKRTLARAQMGTQQGDDGGGPQLHTESHLGGDPACPTMSSRSPDYTLIVTAVPRGATGRKLSQSDGVASVFFDFKGDLGLAAPSGISKALSVNVTVVAEDPATPPAWVAMDVSVGLTEGNVAGHVYAQYCASLSE